MRLLMVLLVFTIMVGFSALRSQAAADAQQTDTHKALGPRDVERPSDLKTFKQRGGCSCRGSVPVQCICKAPPQRKLSEKQRSLCRRRGINSSSACVKLFSPTSKKEISTPV